MLRQLPFQRERGLYSEHRWEGIRTLESEGNRLLPALVQSCNQPWGSSSAEPSSWQGPLLTCTPWGLGERKHCELCCWFVSLLWTTSWTRGQNHNTEVCTQCYGHRGGSITEEMTLELSPASRGRAPEVGEGGKDWARGGEKGEQEGSKEIEKPIVTAKIDVTPWLRCFLSNIHSILVTAPGGSYYCYSHVTDEAIVHREVK